MDYPQFYLVLSISIGLLQVFDSVLLAKTKGHLTTPNAFISALEFGWIIISTIALLRFGDIPKYLPLSFIGFAVAGGIYGLTMLKGIRPEEDEIIPKDLVAPPWLIAIGGLFGAYFATASYFVHQNLFR